MAKLQRVEDFKKSYANKAEKYRESIEIEGLIRHDLIQQGELLTNVLRADIKKGCEILHKMLKISSMAGRLQDFSEEIMANNLDFMKESGNWEYVRFLEQLAENSTSENRNKALPHIRELVRNNFANPKEDTYRTKPIFQTLLRRGTEEDFQEFSQVALDAWLKEPKYSNIDLIVRGMLRESKYSDMHDRGIRLLCIKTGLDKEEVEDLINAWKCSWEKDGKTGKDMSYRAVEMNLEGLGPLDSASPGIASKLYRNFGIKNFRRYPVEMLVDQVENMDDNSLPYGIVIYPKNDWNGAFYQDRRVLENVHRGLNGKYTTRIIECDGKRAIARRLLQFNNKYNSGENPHLISYAIVGAHGTPSDMRFGGSKENEILQVEDFSGHGVRKTKHFFEVGAPFILASCSTGVRRGIGQRMSSTLGVGLDAPDSPSSLEDIETSVDDEYKLHMNAVYTKAQTMNYYLGNEIRN